MLFEGYHPFKVLLRSSMSVCQTFSLVGFAKKGIDQPLSIENFRQLDFELFQNFVIDMTVAFVKSFQKTYEIFGLVLSLNSEEEIFELLLAIEMPGQERSVHRN